MDVFAKQIEFDGVNLMDEYGVTLASFDIPDSKRETGISYEINSSDITPYRPVANYYNKRYREPLKFNITFIKMCRDTNYFSMDEQRKIVRIITSPTDYRILRILDYDDNSYHYGIEYDCICTDYQEVSINNQIVGLTFSFQCNAPYGYYNEVSTSFNTSSSTTITIDNYSDEREALYYPKIELKSSDTGSVVIKNEQTPDNDMQLEVYNGQTLYIDCDACDISDDIEMFKYSTDTNLKWLSLLPGKNKITITGNVSGKITCRYPRKVGI